MGHSKLHHILPAILAGVFLLSETAYSDEKLEVGRNSAVKGEVKIKSIDEEISRQALVKEPVFLGDNVNSRVGSSLQVLLKDKSTFTVGPQCDMVIDKFVYDPNKNTNSLSAKVKKGMFRFTSGNVSKTNPDEIIVATPTATMGIRGTMVEVLVGPEAFLCSQHENILVPGVELDHAGATLVILRGPGDKHTTNNQKGEVIVSSGGKDVVLTQAGTGVLVSNAEEKPSEVFKVSEDLHNYFNRRLRTKPSRTGNFRPFTIDEAWFTPITIEDEHSTIFTPLEAVEDMDWPSQSFDDIEFDDNFIDIEN